MTETLLNRTVETKRKIASRETRIGVVGMGYVGLPLALFFAEKGFAITGIDIDPAKEKL